MLTGAPGHDIVEKNRRDLCHGTDPVPQGGAPLNKNLLRSILLIITYSVVLVLVMIFRPQGIFGSWEFSLPRLVNRMLFRGAAGTLCGLKLAS